ncbi:MAG: DUF58 domain-containing protein [Lachnospiraceae bacterium]|nr:DUF58 domain-containing protein [Lachnospiraceae bacterium]
MILILLAGLLFFLLYCGHTYYYRRRWKENFQVDIGFSENQAGEGDQLFLYETAVNNKKMKLPVLCVKFQASKYLRFEDTDSGSVSDYYYRNDVMSVDGFQKVRRKLRFTCKKRGLYQIQEAELVSYDLFCTHTFAHKKTVQASLCVYPSRIDIQRLLPVFRHMTGGLVTPVPLYEDPYAYAGVRAYTPQDSMRRIHWKASARTGQWQVKTTEYQAGAPVVILLNLESPGVFTDMDLMEDSIRLAYSFIYYLSKNGIPTRLVAGGEEMVRLEGNGQEQLAAVRHALAVISYKNVCCNGLELLAGEAEKLRPDTHVIFISPAGKMPLQQAVTGILRKGVPVTWVAPMITENGADSEFREVSPGLEKCLIKWGGAG